MAWLNPTSKKSRGVMRFRISSYRIAVIAQLGERETEDLEVPGSIPGHGSLLLCPTRAHPISTQAWASAKLAKSGFDPPTFEL